MFLSILIVTQFIVTLIMGVYFFYMLKGQRLHKGNIDCENKLELENLKSMEENSLNIPLTEKSRPQVFGDIIGQDNGIKALKAAICSSNPQHVIIYGPPGVGKTAAARLVLEYAKKKEKSPFKDDAKFIEIDATTIRFDERGIADPLIGSVHDPIYQGAGVYGVYGIPQPKPGAVTKAHGGILFIDEIGELNPIIMNKLLKVLEDRRVFFESAYYNKMDLDIPNYVKEVFDNGLPADFRMIAATTRSPDEISPALRSRCVEIFFKVLNQDEVERIAESASYKCGISIEENAKKLIGKYATNGREIINIIQLCVGIAEEDNRNTINFSDAQWVIENGEYSPRDDRRVSKYPDVGSVTGLGVFGANIGAILEIEASAERILSRKGEIKITGVVEEEELSLHGKKIKRKSLVRCSVENVITVLNNLFKIKTEEYDIHVNFLGGMAVDGPSAGIALLIVIYSAIKNIKINNQVAMTGEINLKGKIKAVGGIKAKISAAIRAGATKIIIPMENYNVKMKDFIEIQIIPVETIEDVIKASLLVESENNEKIIKNEINKIDLISAEGINFK